MAHAQKTDFVFRRNGRVCLNRQRRQFNRLLAADVCASAVVMLDSLSSEVVKGTGYPLHLPVPPSLPLPCLTVCHHISTGLYIIILNMFRASTRPSSGGQIVLSQHLVSSLSVNGCTVCRMRADSSLIRHTVQPFTESDDTRCCDNTICPPEDGHVNARNM